MKCALPEIERRWLVDPPGLPSLDTCPRRTVDDLRGGVREREEAANYTPPSFAVEEITGNLEYSGFALAEGE